MPKKESVVKVDSGLIAPSAPVGIQNGESKVIVEIKATKARTAAMSDVKQTLPIDVSDDGKIINSQSVLIKTPTDYRSKTRKVPSGMELSRYYYSYNKTVTEEWVKNSPTITLETPCRRLDPFVIESLLLHLSVDGLSGIVQEYLAGSKESSKRRPLSFLVKNGNFSHLSGPKYRIVPLEEDEYLNLLRLGLSSSWEKCGLYESAIVILSSVMEKWSVKQSVHFQYGDKITLSEIPDGDISHLFFWNGISWSAGLPMTVNFPSVYYSDPSRWSSEDEMKKQHGTFYKPNMFVGIDDIKDGNVLDGKNTKDIVEAKSMKLRVSLVYGTNLRVDLHGWNIERLPWKLGLDEIDMNGISMIWSSKCDIDDRVIERDDCKFKELLQPKFWRISRHIKGEAKESFVIMGDARRESLGGYMSSITCKDSPARDSDKITMTMWSSSEKLLQFCLNDRVHLSNPRQKYWLKCQLAEIFLKEMIKMKVSIHNFLVLE